MKGIWKSLLTGIQMRWGFGKAWFRGGRQLWIWLVRAAIIFGIPFLVPATLLGLPAGLPDRMRWSGMLFQFAGLAMVVVGLNLSRQVFGRNSIWKAIIQWLGRARYIVVPLKPITGRGDLRAGLAMMGDAEVTVSGRKESQNIDERVAALEAELGRLDGKLTETRQEVRKLQSDTNDRIINEQAERQSEDQKISKRLETAAIGGIHLELAGVAYLVVGIALTSVPDEIAALIRAVGL